MSDYLRLQISASYHIRIENAENLIPHMFIFKLSVLFGVLPGLKKTQFLQQRLYFTVAECKFCCRGDE